MIKLKRYYTALRRYKHSKGFGIHSPFAFRFVLQVLSERYPYYAYEEISQSRRNAIRLASKISRHPRIISYKNAKILFRITCYFTPKAILQIGTNYGVSTTAMMNVSSSSRMFIFAGEETIRHGIYQEITKDYRNRITDCGTVREAFDSYSTAIGQERPFILVNDIAKEDWQYAKDSLDAAICQGGVIIFRNIGKHPWMRSLWESAKSGMPHGISFSNERLGVITALEHLPLQHIQMWF